MATTSDHDVMRAGTPDSGGPTHSVGQDQLCLLLLCFAGKRTAARVRKGVEVALRADGTHVLDCTVVNVNGKHKAHGYDPHRVLFGTLVPALTWGLFGLVLGSYGWLSAIIWAVVGAVCGALFSYYSVTRLSKREWARIGAGLPSNSSALVFFVETTDVHSLLKSTASKNPATASAVQIKDDLVAHGFSTLSRGVDVPVETTSAKQATDRATTLSMVMLRFAAQNQAKKAATAMSQHPKGSDPVLAVELIVEKHAKGDVHVIDPNYGTWAWARSDVVSWGLFGVAVGLVSGFVSGGLFGAVGSGVATGLIWAAFGLFAGSLYGLWAGRAVSARRLKIADRLVPPERSMVLAWSQQPITAAALAPFAGLDSQHVVVLFNSVQTGAVLEAG